MKRLLLVLALAACSRSETVAPAAPAQPLSGSGNAENGRTLISRYSCTTCHEIPGTVGPQGALGPSLAGIAARPTLADGTVQNTPENLVRYIQNPASLNPQTSMPTLGVNDTEARDMAAYLSKQ